MRIKLKTVMDQMDAEKPDDVLADLEAKHGSQQRMVRSLCECVNWARAVNLKYLTNHHENCPHYNDSLMDVWKVTVDGVSCYVDNEQDARETAGDEQRDDITVTKEKMHREVFDHLPEFEGF